MNEQVSTIKSKEYYKFILHIHMCECEKYTASAQKLLSTILRNVKSCINFSQSARAKTHTFYIQTIIQLSDIVLVGKVSAIWKSV